MIDQNKNKRGFAAMDEDKQRGIARQGGRAAHQSGQAHEFSPEEAREAGRKGGQIAHQKGAAHKFSSEEARLAGSKGGRAAHRRDPQPERKVETDSPPEEKV
jgi:general stress protein YciG